MSLWIVPLTACLAALVQSLSGFGSGMIPMAILPARIGIRTVSPLVALITATVDIGMLMRYRAAARSRAVLPLAAGMVMGIPLGILFLRRVGERWVLGALGVVIVLYALYSLARSAGFAIPLPLRRASRGAESALIPVATGLIAGVLGGAYNTSGPPLILYGDLHRWEPDEFRGNLQTLFLLNDIFVITGHLVAGNMAPAVLHGYLMALPGLGAGFLFGGLLARRLAPQRFRLLVQGLLLLLGARLLFS